MKLLSALQPKTGPNTGGSVSVPGYVPQGGSSTLPKYLSVVVDLLFVTAVLATVIFLVWGGIDWITSGGDRDKLSRARLKITYAVLGLVLTFLSYFIVNTIYRHFGLTFF